MFEVKTRRYEYFDWQLYFWTHFSNNTPPVNVKEAGKLFFRSLGVTTAPGMPGAAVKRTASQAGLDQTETPFIEGSSETTLEYVSMAWRSRKARMLTW